MADLALCCFWSRAFWVKNRSERAKQRLICAICRNRFRMLPDKSVIESQCSHYTACCAKFSHIPRYRNSRALLITFILGLSQSGPQREQVGVDEQSTCTRPASSEGDQVLKAEGQHAQIITTLGSSAISILKNKKYSISPEKDK